MADTSKILLKLGGTTCSADKAAVVNTELDGVDALCPALSYTNQPTPANQATLEDILDMTNQTSFNITD